MNKAEDLKRIMRAVLGRGAGAYYARFDRMLEEGDFAHASLLSVTRKIESIVRFYINVEKADLLGEEFREYLKKNSSYL